MKSTLITLAAAAGSAYAATAPGAAYAQCGGQGWTGATTCVSGYTCTFQNAYYSQCVSGAAAPPASTKTSATNVVTVTTAKATTAKATTTKATTTKATASSAAATTRATTVKAAATSAAAASSGKVKFAGVNISGFDFGCGTDGTCSTGGIVNPGSAGISQMDHFVKDDGLNAFRLPVGWQYLVNNVLGGTLDAANLANYDALVQGCLSSGASLCIIDVHNYARWNGAIIGQGGPTNAQFTSLWTQLATKYKTNTKVAFGVMNEPHDVDVTEWAATVQAVVTAIRTAGATSNLILLPGTQYTSATAFVSDGSAAALVGVKNLDGSTTNLAFDVHAYLDSDNSGTHASCTTNNVAGLGSLATWLRTNGRQALLSETGGGATDSTCLTNVCQELSFLMKNSDVFLGWTGWGAGEFATSYVLAETPSGSPGSYVDQPLVTQCIAGIFNGKTKISSS